MAIFFGVSVVVLLVYAIWKKLHLRYEQTRFKYELYAVRDKLRWDAMNGKVDSSNWLFDYYDNTISKIIAHSYELTLFGVTGMESLHRNDVRIQNFRVDLQTALSKDDYFESLDAEIKLAAVRYMKNQHMVSVNYIILPIFLPILKVFGLFQSTTKALRELTTFPEISDSSGRLGISVS